jgi:hypothetical protein
MTERLKSKRESVASYQTPINRVKGTLESRELEQRKGQFAKEGQNDVILKVTNIQEVESDTPYPYKTAELRLKFSNSITSSWALFEESIAEALGKDIADGSVDDVVGSVVTLEKEKNHLFFTDKVGKESRGDVWRVTAVEGKGASTANYAVDLLKGKSKEEFEKIASEDATIKKNVKLLSSIMSGKFYASPEVTEKYHEVAGVFVEK